MLKAVIFDFDGVIANTEPVHFGAFVKTLGERGISLTEEDYYADYLAFDDKTFFRTLLGDRGHKYDDELILELVRRKGVHYGSLIAGNIKILPGASDFISGLAGSFRLAIGSGALRGEIIDILEYAGLREYFEEIVSAEDIENCKPAPDVYIEVLRRLNASGGADVISPAECLVVEDSVSGLKAALSAGMKCLAVTNSYSADALSGAHLVAGRLDEIGLEDIKRLF